MLERDFVGYANEPPQVEWPGGASLALSLAVNFEEGAERSILDGDPESDPQGETPARTPPGDRHGRTGVDEVLCGALADSRATAGDQHGHAFDRPHCPAAFPGLRAASPTPSTLRGRGRCDRIDMVTPPSTRSVWPVT